MTQPYQAGFLSDTGDRSVAESARQLFLVLYLHLGTVPSTLLVHDVEAHFDGARIFPGGSSNVVQCRRRGEDFALKQLRFASSSDIPKARQVRHMMVLVVSACRTLSDALFP
jgi:hypothetical protein